MVRIVDLNKLLAAVNEFSHIDCKKATLFIQQEQRQGLCSTIDLVCSSCGTAHRIPINDDKLNELAVLGTFVAGVGHTGLSKILSVMNVPNMSDKTYTKYSDIIGNLFFSFYFHFLFYILRKVPLLVIPLIYVPLMNRPKILRLGK